MSELHLNSVLVEQLKGRGYLSSQAVEDAFRAVPRHHFLPGVPLETAYGDCDQPVPTRWEAGIAVSSSSAPSIMAVMLEQLDVRPGHRVLEIGAGTGYNACLLSRMTVPGGRVTSVDIEEALVIAARAHSADAEASGVEFVCADGAHGWPVGAPYARIVLTAGSADVSPAWIEQLEPGGRLLLPLELTPGYSKSVAFERRDGHLHSVSLRDCGFMPLRGVLAPLDIMPRAVRRVDTGVVLSATQPEALWRRLREQTPLHHNLGVNVSPMHLWHLRLWLSLWAPDAACCVQAQGDAASREDLPTLFSPQRSPLARISAGLESDRGACLLHRGTDGLEVWEYGDGADLVARLRTLAARPQPPGESISIRAYPGRQAIEASKTRAVLPRRWSTLVVSWS
ncbi:MAG TPA: methyltransferase domain-containing protein [Candidatus Dormibacteraeota bacterium]|nr:methyltransferase domain-containing protein [Candidatus Dormibacteraeota bacterium]